MDLGRGTGIQWTWAGGRYSVDLGRGQVFSGLGQGAGIQWT